MKKLFNKIMDRIETYFLNKRGIDITISKPKIAYSELNLQERFSQVFISYDELRSTQNYSDFIESALKIISHKIGEELLKDGFLIVESEEDPNRRGIDINVIGYFSKPKEKPEPETVDIICEKIGQLLF